MNPIKANQYIIYFSEVSMYFSCLTVRATIHRVTGDSFEIKSIDIPELGPGEPILDIIHQSSDIDRFDIEVQKLVSKDCTDQNISSAYILFITNTGETKVNIGEAINSSSSISSKAYDDFLSYLETESLGSVLDIGGRARSGILRSESLKQRTTTVIDILPDKGVDVVGDAHRLSEYFPNSSFDACMCISVFEHIIMPWVVVIEMNKILKTGGIVFIATHQSIGMHDIPCDHYRYSDTAWHGLLNKDTGYEIIKTEMSGLNHITPFFSARRGFHEKAAGYESSCVIARKISSSKNKWRITDPHLNKITYPA
jgi:hypothetical protein